MTIHLSVPNMSCGHCVRSITEAVQRVDAQATVTADVGLRRVSIESGAASAQQLAAAIEEAGYPSQPAP